MRKILYSIMLVCASFFSTAQTVADIVINSPDHNILEQAVIAADLAGTLSGPGNFTVFAPTDAAFAELGQTAIDALLQDPTGDLQKILLHHVLENEVFAGDLSDGLTATTVLGQGITFTINGNGAFINTDIQITVTDRDATNGVVHVVDAVILPAATVADIVINSPVHGTLEAAVTAAGLLPALQGTDDLTVFAPTDAAFAALGQATIDALLQDPTGDLAKILTYHVVGGEVLAGDLMDGMTAPTLFGPDITFTINPDGVFINDNVQVTMTDIRTLNGVVHVVDAVILPTATVADVVINSPVHGTLEAAVTAAGLLPALQGTDDLTVFAPTDAAFAALGQATIDALLQDPTGDLAKILTYHVVGGEVLAGDLMDGMTAPTLFGPDITFTINPDGVFINDNVQVTMTDIRTLNGVVHVVDAVILPTATVADVVINSPVHGTLEAAVTAAGLLPALQGTDDLTVFAPTDAAFAALGQATIDALLQDPTGDLAKILTYHVVGGEVLAGDLMDGMTAPTLFGPDITFTINPDGVFINDNVQVTMTDIRTLNGVVHVVDAVILPTATVADVVINSPVHGTLEAAVTAAGLLPALQGTDDLTVFAPTDAAFAALGQATIDALLQDPTGDLAKILTYHVVGGEVLAGDLMDGMTAPTLFGPDITFTINPDGVFINDNVQVTMTDIRTLNGVVHVVDAVILPTATVADVVINSPVHGTLEAAVTAAGLLPALQGTDDLTVFAPTDAAFAALGQATIDALLQDPTGDLAKILTYHVVGGEVLAGDLMDGMTAPTLFGPDITFTINPDGVFINDNVQVTMTDIRTLNGVVHVVDAVILPTATVADVVINSPVHGTLEAAVTAAGLLPALQGTDDLTVFAPTDAAFAALGQATIDALLQDPTGDLAKILTYHVVGGEVLAGDLMDGMTAPTLFGPDITFTINPDGVFINDNVQVTMTDIRTLNGVVHVVDAVILPTATVADVVINSPVHGTLEAAVTAAGLLPALQGTDDLTVFAPTDAAFAALGQATIDALLQDPTGDLAKILQYHVVEGEVLSGDLSDGQVTTLFGQDITVSIDADGVLINNSARVTVADIRTLNGVVHVIDAVLLPNLSSVKDLQEIPVQIYPNPATDFITVDLPVEYATEESVISIISMEGRVLKNQRTTGNQAVIDVTDLSTGNYVLVLRSKSIAAKSMIVIK